MTGHPQVDDTFIQISENLPHNHDVVVRIAKTFLEVAEELAIKSTNDHISTSLRAIRHWVKTGGVIEITRINPMALKTAPGSLYDADDISRLSVFIWSIEFFINSGFDAVILPIWSICHPDVGGYKMVRDKINSEFGNIL